MDIFPSYLLQEVLADFILEGHFTRHIRKMRQLYKQKRTIWQRRSRLNSLQSSAFKCMALRPECIWLSRFPQGEAISRSRSRQERLDFGCGHFRQVISAAILGKASFSVLEAQQSPTFPARTVTLSHS